MRYLIILTAVLMLAACTQTDQVILEKKCSPFYDKEDCKSMDRFLMTMTGDCINRNLGNLVGGDCKNILNKGKYGKDAETFYQYKLKNK